MLVISISAKANILIVLFDPPTKVGDYLMLETIYSQRYLRLEAINLDSLNAYT